MNITPAGGIMIAMVLFSFWATLRILKRMGKGERPGCGSVIYVWLVVFSISSLTFGGAMILYDTLSDFTRGERIEATIIDSTEHAGSRDDDDGPMYFPVIRFTAPNGEVITREGNTGSSSPPTVGDPYVIYYDNARNSLSNFSLASLLLLAAGSLMTFILSTLSFGMVRYALGYDMASFWRFCQKFVTLVLIPLMMFAMDGMLIFAMIFAGPHPRWVYGLLGVFIFGLSVAILGYLKTVFRKGAPKWQRTGTTEWSADWDDSGDDAADEKKPAHPSKQGKTNVPGR